MTFVDSLRNPVESWFRRIAIKHFPGWKGQIQLDMDVLSNELKIRLVLESTVTREFLDAHGIEGFLVLAGMETEAPFSAEPSKVPEPEDDEEALKSGTLD